MAAFVLRLKCGCVLLPNQLVRVTPEFCRHASIKSPVVASEPAQFKRGTGGRSSFSGKVVTVFGASGFLGRAVVNQLGKQGSQIIIPYRGDFHVVKKLKLCGDLGQIYFQPFNLKDEDSIQKAVKYSNVVINLIGRNHETKNFPFEEVHVKGARNIAKIARESGVKTLVHVSALNACEKPKPIILKKGSGFYASKWRGENAVREEFPDAVVFRPSDLFGQGDNFCCYYGSLWRHTYRSLSLWNKGEGIIKQPAFISDVSKAIAKVALDDHYHGKTYQAVGPHRYELAELVDWFHRVMMRTQERLYYRFDMRYDVAMWMKVLYSEWFFPKIRTLSFERLEREHTTDVFDPHIPTLTDLGIELTPLEDRIFFELKRFRAHAYQDPLLTQYLRDVEPAPIVRN